MERTRRFKVCMVLVCIWYTPLHELTCLHPSPETVNLLRLMRFIYYEVCTCCSFTACTVAESSSVSANEAEKSVHMDRKKRPWPTSLKYRVGLLLAIPNMYESTNRMHCIANYFLLESFHSSLRPLARYIRILIFHQEIKLSSVLNP